MREKIRVIAVDNAQLAINGYKKSLESDERFDLIGVAYNGKELLDILPSKIPDIIILDLEMPVMDGKETLEVLKSQYPEIKVLIASFHNTEALLTYYLENGAHGYISKDSDKLVEALISIKNGKYYLDTLTARQIVLDHIDLKKLLFLNQSCLKDRERKILKLICCNQSSKQIANKLCMSVHTVNSYRQKIYKKTNTGCLPDLIKYAIKTGIIPLE